MLVSVSVVSVLDSVVLFFTETPNLISSCDLPKYGIHGSFASSRSVRSFNLVKRIKLSLMCTFSSEAGRSKLG